MFRGIQMFVILVQSIVGKKDAEIPAVMSTIIVLDPSTAMLCQIDDGEMQKFHHRKPILLVLVTGKYLEQI